MNNYLLLGLSVLTLVALNQRCMKITNYVPIMLLRNKYIPNFIFFLSPLPPFRKGSHCGSVNTEFTRWDVDRNFLGRGIPSGNKDFNGLGLKREFPKGRILRGEFQDD